jgi:hypothetical protein
MIGQKLHKKEKSEQQRDLEDEAVIERMVNANYH